MTNRHSKAPVVITADRLGQLLAPRQGKQRLVLMVGIPGSGKSTVGDGIEKSGYVRLSYDAVRQRLFGDATEHGEEGQVGKTFRAQLREALTAGQSVLVDNTNFLTEMRTHIIDIARQCGVDDVHLVVMKVPLPECLRRNRARDRVVPTRTVRHMNWMLSGSEWPKGSEGRMTIVRPGPDRETYLVSGFAAAYAN
jgi:predicted kinase